MQAVKLTPGVYVVAVSGGLDSMVLLDVLRRDTQLTLVVAHANHGQRIDAGADEALVAQYAKQHGLSFVAERLALPMRCSEEQARRARYEFLQRCSKKHAALAIVTAHHQDDMLETVIMNIIRGTGWRGLAPFSESDYILRPLLTYTKDDLLAYARKHHLTWREDTTNHDETYLRNYIRHTIIPHLNQKSDTWQTVLLQLVRKQQQVRTDIKQELTQQASNAVLPRYMLIMLPHSVAYELLQHALYAKTSSTFVRPLTEQLLLFAKTGRAKKVMPLSAHWRARLTQKELIVEPSHSW